MGSIITGSAVPFLAADRSDVSSGGKRTVTVSWHGPYAVLASVKPAQGLRPASFSALLPVTGIPADLTVVSADAKRDEAGYGTLTVTLSGSASATYEPAPGTSVIRTTLEIEMSQIERPIEFHSGLRGGSDSTEAVENLDLWRNERIRAVRKAFKYRLTDDAPESAAVSLTATEKKWAQKILMGVESFLVFSPVVTRTTVTDYRPTDLSCGLISAPPIAVAGFTSYLKTADRVVSNDGGLTWTRTEAWTAALPTLAGVPQAWDPDLYKTSYT